MKINELLELKVGSEYLLEAWGATYKLKIFDDNKDLDDIFNVGWCGEISAVGWKDDRVGIYLSKGEPYELQAVAGITLSVYGTFDIEPFTLLKT